MRHPLFLLVIFSLVVFALLLVTLSLSPAIRRRYDYHVVRRWHRFADAACHLLARRMPRRLRYWATIVSGAEATTGRHGATVVTEITFCDVLQRVGAPGSSAQAAA